MKVFYSPNNFPLCKMLGFKECKFGLGLLTPREVISHFLKTHKSAHFKYLPYLWKLNKFNSELGKLLLDHSTIVFLAVGEIATTENSCPLFLLASRAVENGQNTVIKWTMYQI